MEDIIIHYRKKKINIRKVHRLSFMGRFTGLMFKTKNTKKLLFDFSKEVKISIHSLFVFFPFLAVWLDKNNSVVERQIVGPFRLYILPRKNFCKLVEIPLNDENKMIIGFFVGKIK